MHKGVCCDECVSNMKVKNGVLWHHARQGGFMRKNHRGMRRLIRALAPVLILSVIILSAQLTLHFIPDTSGLYVTTASVSRAFTLPVHAQSESGMTGANSTDGHNDDAAATESVNTNTDSLDDGIENEAEIALELGPVSIFDNSSLPDLNADAYILIDRKTGQTICSKNPEMRMYPASITKIITGILAIEMGDLSSLMTTSAAAIRDIGPGGSNIGMIAGENMRLDNLLDVLLVKSGNESANIIAENLCETREEFVELMNQKAIDLGATNTHFTNTSGYHEESHYTTAYDLAKIANYAMNNGKFREYVSKRSFVLSPTNKHAEWDRMWTTNQLLLEEGSKGYAITGVKTGYTTPAGYCLAASGIDNNDMELLCIVLGVRGDTSSASRFKIANDLLSYGFDNFRVSTFIRERDLVETISVLGGANVDTVDAVSDGTVKLFLPVDQEKWSISKVEYVRSEITAPVSKGEVLGYVEFRNNGKFAGRVNVVASENIIASRNVVRQTPKRIDTGSGNTLYDKEGNPLNTEAARQTLVADRDTSVYNAEGDADRNNGSNARDGSDGYSTDYNRSGGEESDSGNLSRDNTAAGVTNNDAGRNGGGTETDSGSDNKKTGFFSNIVVRVILIALISIATAVSVIRTINRARYLKRQRMRALRKRHPSGQLPRRRM